MKTMDNKPWFKSKTLWVNIVVFGLAAVEAIQNNTLNPNILMLCAVINVFLRMITNKTLTVGSKVLDPVVENKPIQTTN